MPRPTVVPVLAYPAVNAAADWLCTAFSEPATQALHSVMVRVEDVDDHHQQAAAHGARVLQPPQDYAYGERQYTVADLAGHRWTFSQTIADVDPADWGGKMVDED